MTLRAVLGAVGLTLVASACSSAPVTPGLALAQKACREWQRVEQSRPQVTGSFYSFDSDALTSAGFDADNAAYANARYTALSADITTYSQTFSSFTVDTIDQDCAQI